MHVAALFLQFEARKLFLPHFGLGNTRCSSLQVSPPFLLPVSSTQTASTAIYLDLGIRECLTADLMYGKHNSAVNYIAPLPFAEFFLTRSPIIDRH